MVVTVRYSSHDLNTTFLFGIQVMEMALIKDKRLFLVIGCRVIGLGLTGKCFPVNKNFILTFDEKFISIVVGENF